MIESRMFLPREIGAVSFVRLHIEFLRSMTARSGEDEARLSMSCLIGPVKPLRVSFDRRGNDSRDEKGIESSVLSGWR